MLPQHGTLQLSTARLRHNLNLFRNAAPRLAATIKANAYGHGIDTLAPLLLQQNITWACVYNLHEALHLATYPWHGLLVLAPFVASTPLDPALAARLAPPIRLNLTDLASARYLSAALTNCTAPLPVHIQIDAGLTRAGVAPAEAPALIAAVAALPNLHLEGLFAHFSHGDAPNHPTLQQQYDTLMAVARPFKQRWPHLLVHLQNSGGAINLPHPSLDMVRLGIALYGLQPSTSDPILNLQPIARVVAPILDIHARPAGVGVGYGHTFLTQRHTRIAIVPVGYADGYPRQLSNHCVAQLRGRDVPVVGRVSMDQITLDVTDIPDAAIGDEVIVISDDPAKPNCLDRMADAIGTIGYELATHLGPRLARTITP